LYNQFKDLRTEQYAAIYAQPIYPKNQYLKEAPKEGWLAREEATRARNIQELVKRGVFTPPDRGGAVARERGSAVIAEQEKVTT
jgi:hypothetical protein